MGDGKIPFVLRIRPWKRDVNMRIVIGELEKEYSEPCGYSELTRGHVNMVSHTVSSFLALAKPEWK
jgi:hypothetical protein